MATESPPIVRPTSPEHARLALLSALAEAPDLAAAATFLLTDIMATTGARRAALLRFDMNDEQLVLTASAGMDDSLPSELTIPGWCRRSH
jgi:hypothetical protein